MGIFITKKVLVIHSNVKRNRLTREKVAVIRELSMASQNICRMIVGVKRARLIFPSAGESFGWQIDTELFGRGAGRIAVNNSPGQPPVTEDVV